MLRQIGSLIAIAFFVAAVNTAEAGLLEVAITPDGEMDVLQDNSVGLVLLDAGVAGRIDAGDVIGGLVRIQKNTTDGFDVSPTLGELVVVFSAEVLGQSAGVQFGNGVKFDLAPTVTSQAILAGLLPTHGVFPLGSVAATLSAPASSSPVDPTTQAFFPTALANLNSGIWSRDAVLGFDTSGVGGTNEFGDFDFFEAELRDFSGNGFIEVAELLARSVGSLIGAESGGFSMLDGPNFLYLPVLVDHLDGATTTLHQVGIPSTSLLRPNATEAANLYAFADQANVLVNPAPEPSSMVLLGLGALTGLGLRARRRQQAA
jgi:hypothetical protein